MRHLCQGRFRPEWDIRSPGPSNQSCAAAKHARGGRNTLCFCMAMMGGLTLIRRVAVALAESAAYVAHTVSALIIGFYIWQMLITRGEANMLALYVLIPLLAVAGLAVLLSFAVRSRALVRLSYLTITIASSAVIAVFFQLGFFVMLAVLPVAAGLTLWGLWHDWRSARGGPTASQASH